MSSGPRTVLYTASSYIFPVVLNLLLYSIRVSAIELDLAEITQIVLPIDWAMCEELWYGMVLVAHPHGYPHAVHIFCGHGVSVRRCPESQSPFSSRRFKPIAMKDLFGSSVSSPTPAVVPWSERIGAHDMKTRHALYRCSVSSTIFRLTRMIYDGSSRNRPKPCSS